MEAKQGKLDEVEQLAENLTEMIGKAQTAEYDADLAVEMLEKFSKDLPEVRAIADEIPWDMLSAQAFITSVQTTTGLESLI